MRELFGHVDRLLRGQYTRREDLREGHIGVASGTLAKAGIVLGAAYGAFMGIFAVLRPTNPSWVQLLASMAKVPLLFLLTLVVTFPSLYVFAALSNTRLRAADTMRLLLAAVTVNLALLASFGPVTAFFTLSTESYRFIIVLNVVFFTISGFAGLAFLRRALANLFESDGEEPRPPAPPPPESDADTPEARKAARLEALVQSQETPTTRHRRSHAEADAAVRVFRIWTITYAVVGAQMAWILRPFIGTPSMQFTFFRPRGSNFFEAMWHTVLDLFR